MKREEKLHRHRWRWRIALLVLLIHIVIYSIFWITILGPGSSIQWRIAVDAADLADFVLRYQQEIFYALLWLPTLLIHLGVHLYLAGRSDAGVGERQAYRDGFHDGAQYAAPEDAYEPRRLTVDEALEEDGELAEWEGKRKRSGR